MISDASLTSEVTYAVIYCRVSSAKQRAEGAGLESQEHRCRQYAQSKGYQVEAVFPDDASGGGDFMKRPGMVALLSYIEAQPDKSYVVIFDDLKRFARDTMFHLKLRQEFDGRRASVECLNFKFEDTPEGKFVETMLAATGELEREQNRRQTIQKMKARVEKGYYVWNTPPRGFRYEARRGEGKVLVRDEPHATILQEAFEGYASGRLQTQVEVKRFLEAQPLYPKDLPDGTIRNQRVHDILTNPTYAGYVQAPSWGVSLRRGAHDGIVSLQTFERVQERLKGTAKAPARKDISADFPLRGFILCDDCSQPMTSCWSKSKTGERHPYYMCKTKGCTSYRKSIRRDQLEGDFAGLLRRLQPSRGLFTVAKAMFTDIWKMKLSRAVEDRRQLESRLSGIDRQIDKLLDRIVETENAVVAAKLEERMAKFEREKLILAEQIESAAKPRHTVEESFELAMRFLSSPWKIWEKGSLAVQKTVLRLAFLEPVAYSRFEGVRTPKMAFPFKALADLSTGKCEMARWGGFEPPTP